MTDAQLVREIEAAFDHYVPEWPVEPHMIPRHAQLLATLGAFSGSEINAVMNQIACEMAAAALARNAGWDKKRVWEEVEAAGRGELSDAMRALAAAELLRAEAEQP